MSVELESSNQNMSERTTFLVRNLLRGIVGLVAIIGIYVLAKKYLDFDLITLLGPLYEKPVAIYTIFLTSEVVFGIVPPEFFMLWSMRHGDVSLYIQNIAALSTISYVSGIIGYYLGSLFHATKIYRLLRINYLQKFERQFQQFGGFLVIVAALTPLPFSAICMLVGAAKYPFRRFLFIATARFARFVVYSMIIWQTNAL